MTPGVATPGFFGSRSGAAAEARTAATATAALPYSSARTAATATALPHSSVSRPAGGAGRHDRLCPCSKVYISRY